VLDVAGGVRPPSRPACLTKLSYSLPALPPISPLTMVLVSDKKYACETCIKGHRSSACKHTDRPLFEIKKKGRPVTQCDHCRELRKTKQVHVKCLCGAQEMSSNLVLEPSHSKKGATKLPAIAAFPHGLPEDLEAIAILPAASDGSVDSDHSGETSPSGCRCKR
jgi:hypothetical protein